MKNTMSKTEYILTQLWYSFLAMIWFRNTCFTLAFDLSKELSCVVYWGISIITIIWGYKLTYKTKRNGFSVFVNAVLPNGIYLIISYFKYFTTIYWVVLGTGVLLSICLGVLIFSMKVKQGAELSKLFKCRAIRFLHGMRSIASICMVVLIVSIGTNSFLGNPMYKTNIESTSSVFTSKSWTVEQQIDVVKKLQPDVCAELSMEEKQDVLGVVRNIELRYLGINHPVELGFSVLEVNTLGSYNENLYQVLIDLHHLDKSPIDEVLHTLLHEMYHVYQHEQIKVLEYIPEEYQELLMFSNPIEYAEEVANYTDGDDDYFSYRMQSLELMANSYADSGVEQYYELIDKYTKGENDDE